MRNHPYDLHQPTDSFYDNQTRFYMKGFTQRLVVKQRHKDTFIHELLTRAFDCGWRGPALLRTRAFDTVEQKYLGLNFLVIDSTICL